MPTYYRKPYNTMGVFMGPAPSSGYHFVNSTGGLNNNFQDGPRNNNLLQEIERIQGFNYSLNVRRNDISQLGNKGTISRPIVNPSEISLNFDYYQKGVINDLRIGLSSNYAQFHGDLSGFSRYSGHTCILSGLDSRSFRRDMQDPFWPMDCKEPRNIFLVVGNEYLDFHERNKTLENFSGIDDRQGKDPNSSGYSVMAFGDCYLTRYRTDASVNDFIKSSASWVSNNLTIYPSGSGFAIPAINTQTREQFTENKALIPATTYEGAPFILHPGDITLNISRSGDSTPLNVGMDFDNIYIDSYSIDIPLDRQELESVGYKMPLDKPINFPTFANLDFSMQIAGFNSGSWINLLNQDSGYNVSISVKNPCFPEISTANLPNPHQSGPVLHEHAEALRYDFIDAKLKSINYGVGISQNHILANLSFTQEIDTEDLTRGLFMSGLLNVQKVEDYLLDEDGTYLLHEDGSPITTNWSILF